MRLRGSRVWLGLGLALVLAGVGMGWRLRSAHHGRPWVSVRFHGFTNPPNYSQGLAVFVISNCTDRTVIWDAAPEFVLPDGQWSEPRTLFGNFEPRGSGHELKPGETREFRMRYPEDGRSFRAVAGYLQMRSRWDSRRESWALSLRRLRLHPLADWMAPRSRVRKVVSSEHRWMEAPGEP